MKYAFIILFLISALTAKSQVPADGIVAVKCDADTSQSYCIYLPPGYTISKSYPVIFVFDPGARGRRAVGVFREAAKSIGFIIIASNNSQNGALSYSLNSAGRMFTDAFKKYKIDGSHVYLAGFSGGARVATTIALQNPGIAGVLACSAGFPEETPGNALPWFFEGTTGTRDFNNAEMLRDREQLNTAHTTNNLIVFNGPHRWPPEPVIMEALLWFDLQRRKANLDAKDANLLKYQTIIEDKIAKTSSPFEKVEMYRQLLLFNQNATYVGKLKDLEASKAYKNDLIYRQGLHETELTYQKKIGAALLSVERNDYDAQLISWWKTKLATLNKIEASGLATDSDYVYRQKIFIIQNTFAEFENYFDGKKYDIATAFLKILEVFEADNPRIPYNYARLAAIAGNDSEALTYLDSAIKHGLQNKTQMLKDPAFQTLQANKRFITMMAD